MSVVTAAATGGAQQYLKDRQSKRDVEGKYQQEIYKAVFQNMLKQKSAQPKAPKTQLIDGMLFAWDPQKGWYNTGQGIPKKEKEKKEKEVKVSATKRKLLSKIRQAQILLRKNPNARPVDKDGKRNKLSYAQIFTPQYFKDKIYGEYEDPNDPDYMAELNKLFPNQGQPQRQSQQPQNNILQRMLQQGRQRMPQGMAGGAGPMGAMMPQRPPNAGISAMGGGGPMGMLIQKLMQGRQNPNMASTEGGLQRLLNQ